MLRLGIILPSCPLQPLRAEVFIMQILSYLLEVLHVGPKRATHAIRLSHTRGQ